MQKGTETGAPKLMIHNSQRALHGGLIISEFIVLPIVSSNKQIHLLGKTGLYMKPELIVLPFDVLKHGTSATWAKLDFVFHGR